MAVRCAVGIADANVVQSDCQCDKALVVLIGFRTCGYRFAIDPQFRFVNRLDTQSIGPFLGNSDLANPFDGIGAGQRNVVEVQSDLRIDPGEGDRLLPVAIAIVAT